MALIEFWAIAPLLLWIMMALYLLWWYRNGRLRALQGIRIILLVVLWMPSAALVYDLVAGEAWYLLSRYVLRYVGAFGVALAVLWHIWYQPKARS